jgi:hypothetical protein
MRHTFYSIRGTVVPLRSEVLRFLLLLFSCLFFLSGALTKFDVPLAEWDYISMDAAHHWAQGINKIWIFDHPPLYPFFLTILFKLFGSSVAVARAGNIFCVVLAGLLLFRIASILFNRDTAFWTVILYFISPISIQGITCMDVADTSLLPLAFVFTVYALIINSYEPSLRNTCILSAGVALCFWAKVTSSIALITGMLGFSFLCMVLGRKTKNDFREWLFNTAGMLSGVALFFLTWILVSHFLWNREAFLAVFYPLRDVVFARSRQPHLFAHLVLIARHTTIVLIWFSPYFIAMWLYSSLMFAKQADRAAPYHDRLVFVLLGMTIFYFAGYILIGGTNMGFPRYHSAILPLLCLFSGGCVSRFIGKMDGKTVIVMSFALISLIIVMLIFTSDPLYCFLIQLKEMLLLNSGLGKMAGLILKVVLPLYLFPAVAGFLMAVYMRQDNWNDVFKMCLLVGTIATLMSMNGQQFVASYRTAAEYGASGKKDLMEKVQSHIKAGDSILATPQFMYELRDKGIITSGFLTWQSPAAIRDFISRERPSVLIAGLTVNTYEQLRWLLSENASALINKDYTFGRIGTYFLWIKEAGYRVPTASR